MGLDTTHGAWHGAYSAFNTWRNTVAFLAGKSEDPANHYSIPLKILGITDDFLHGDWRGTPDDPIWYLLAHSDCDGYIRSEHCKPLADKLEELAKKAPECLDLGGHVGNFREKTEIFVRGLRAAHETGEDIGFH